MKNIFLIFGLFFSTLFFAQKSENYLQIGFNSICCGPPSTEPVMNFIEKFQCKKRPVEVFRQSGLGREGEFNLYLGIDALSNVKKKKFISGLDSVVKAQNNARNRNRDGIVNFNSSEILKKEELSRKNNLTVYKKEKVK